MKPPTSNRKGTVKTKISRWILAV